MDEESKRTRRVRRNKQERDGWERTRDILSYEDFI